MKISLGSWSFSFGPYASHPIPFRQVAERLAEAGYDGIEICGFSPHVAPESFPDTGSRRELRRMLRDLNLGISGYSPDLTSVNPVVEQNRGAYLELFQRNVDLCAEIGCPLIRVDSGAAPGSIPDSDYADAMNNLAAVWHQAAGVAQRAGVRVGWEFEPGFAFNKPSEIVQLHDQVQHPNFRLIFDTSHAYMCAVAGARQHGEPETLDDGVAGLIELLGDRIGHVHLIDSDGTLYGDETSRHCPFGEGVIDFPALSPALRSIPGAEWWCIDLCFCPNAWDLVGPSREYVARLLARTGPLQ